MSLLVVAGEASGDRLAASVVRALGVPAFGIGGDACARAGVELVAHARDLAAMGVVDVALRAPSIARAFARLIAAARARRPAAAMLVDYAELRPPLGRWLRRRRTRVLAVVAPQVWAWRPSRVDTLSCAIDALAVVLPFEEALWRARGVDARYVGHPALDKPRLSRDAARTTLGLSRGASIAVLPGSRAGEIARLAAPLCDAAARLVAEGASARVLAAPSLPERARAALAETARRAGLRLHDTDPEHGAAPLLPAFDVALAASGTATLEAALAGCAPVVAARLDPIAWRVAQRLVKTPHVALPNVLLGRRAFPELLQDDVTPPNLAAATRALLTDGDAAQRIARELAATLGAASPPAAARIASMLAPWLAASS